jgi:tetratricopeptide (TPR) repeat protein
VSYNEIRGEVKRRKKDMKANDFFEDAKRLFVEGKLRESAEAFTKAADAGYERKISYLSRGAAYLRLREADSAIADFTSVIALDKKSPRAYYYRGMAYAQKKEYGKAIEDFSKAIELKPDDGASIFARGASYLEMGKVDEAAQDIRNATNYLHATVQGYADTIGDKTHLDKVLAILEGERRQESFDMNESEFETVKTMMEEAASAEE